MIQPPDPEAIARLKEVAGDGGWSQDPERIAPRLKEWRDRWTGETPLLLLPENARHVAAIVGCCAEHGVAICTQGGNTGLVGGQIPQGEVLLSTERLRTLHVMASDDAVMAGAGVTLAEVQAAARSAERVFPLSLASEGSATIGGLVSTNAGGTAVLRYGTMRDLVLGVQAVLPDGSAYEGLKVLRKDNTGYDLKHMLIGAEGTLGVITAASLKLFPVLRSRAVAMAGLRRAEDAVTLLARAKAQSGGAVEAFELIGRLGVELAEKNIPGVRDPLGEPYPWLALIEIASAEPGHAEAALERLLASAFDEGLIADAALARSEAQAHALWRMREEQSGAQKLEGSAWKHDIAVPVSRVPRFLELAGAAVEALSPGARVVAFGHVGDGNIHYDVLPPKGGDGGSEAVAHDALRETAALRIHDIAHGLGGSISAEHGLGVMKAEAARRYKEPETVALMQRLRAAFDPRKIMNPRVLF